MARRVDTGSNCEIQRVFLGTDSNWSLSDTGHFRVRRNDVMVYEWKIDHFLRKNHNLETSPCFYFSSGTWYLNLSTCDDDREWLSLRLCFEESTCGLPQIVEFGLGMIEPDGTQSIDETLIRKFEEDEQYGIKFFVMRSNLMERKNDSLTIVCKLRSITSPCENNAGFFPGLLGLLSSKLHSDVTINVKDQEFQAHKVILSASSRVFSDMFIRTMSENNSGVLNIDDCEPDSFKHFLNFLYTGATNITDSNVYRLYFLAYKYRVESLIPFCVGYMILHLSVNTLCPVATLGYQYSDNDIIFACSEFLEKNVQQVLLTSQWKSLMKDHYLIAFELLQYIAPRITIKEKN